MDHEGDQALREMCVLLLHVPKLANTLADVAKETGVTRRGTSGEHIRGLSDQWTDFRDYFNFSTRLHRRRVITLCGTAFTWFFL